MKQLPPAERPRYTTRVCGLVMRIDNVQHNQMGIIKILRAFSDEDFIEVGG